MLTTLGIDLASQAANTAACSIEWDEVVRVSDPVGNLGDDHLVQLINSHERVGIDVPLGWPTKFVAPVAEYHALRPWPDDAAGKEISSGRPTDLLRSERVDGRYRFRPTR